jgi:NADH:ubiquinone oxidoreductase subunit 6 (subunit J)
MSTGTMRALLVLALALLFVGAILQVSWPDTEAIDNTTNEDVGNALFGADDASGYGLVMFFIGLLLLVALLGGVFLAKEEKE